MKGPSKYSAVYKDIQALQAQRALALEQQQQAQQSASITPVEHQQQQQTTPTASDAQQQNMMLEDEEDILAPSIYAAAIAAAKNRAAANISPRSSPATPASSSAQNASSSKKTKALQRVAQTASSSNLQQASSSSSNSRSSPVRTVVRARNNSITISITNTPSPDSNRRRNRAEFEQQLNEEEQDEEENDQQQQQQQRSKRAKPVEFAELMAGLELLRPEGDTETVSRLFSAPPILQYGGKVPVAQNSDYQGALMVPTGDKYWEKVYSTVSSMNILACSEVFTWGVSGMWRSVKLALLRNALPVSGTSDWEGFFNGCISISHACGDSELQCRYAIISITLLAHLNNSDVLEEDDTLKLKRAAVHVLTHCSGNRFMYPAMLRTLRDLVHKLVFTLEGQFTALQELFQFPVVKESSAGSMTLLVVGERNITKLKNAFPGLQLQTMPRGLTQNRNVAAIGIQYPKVDKHVYNDIKEIKATISLLTGISNFDLVCPMNIHHFPHLFVSHNMVALRGYKPQQYDESVCFTLNDYAIAVAPFIMLANSYGPATVPTVDVLSKMNGNALADAIAHLSKYFNDAVHCDVKAEKVYNYFIHTERLFMWYSVILDVLGGFFQDIAGSNILPFLEKHKQDIEDAKSLTGAALDNFQKNFCKPK